jgi:hypothetical protein
MTQRTISSTSRGSQFNSPRIFCVNSGGTMAHFTSDIPMVSRRFHLLDIIVTIPASLMPGIADVLGNDFLNRRRTEMPIFAKIGRDQKIPRGNEKND